MKLSNEIKAGSLILIAILVTVFFILKTVHFADNPYELKTSFKYAGGLKADVPVKLAGIAVGRVKTLEFIYEPETRVECTLMLNDGTKVRTDAIAYVESSGFMGDANIGLTAGKSKEFLKPNATITSEEPLQMRDLIKKADKIASNLDDTLLEVKSLVTNINSMVINNTDNVDAIVLNIEASTQNFKEFTEDVKQHPWKLLFKGE